MDNLDAFYSNPGIEHWESVLGPELHYHYGYYRDDSVSFEQAQCEALRNFYPHIAVGTTVVDAGCGWGACARLLQRERDCSVHGITVSRAQHRYCRDQGLQVTLGDLEDPATLLLPADVVLMMESLEHIRNKSALLERLHGVAPTLLVRTTCCAGLRESLAGDARSWGLTLEPPELITRRLERAGWRVESVVNRRLRSVPTLVHWAERIDAAFGAGTPPGHLGLLRDLCRHGLADRERWVKASPLLDIVARRA